MKAIPLVAITTALAASSYALADDDLSINLMALKASGVSIETFTTAVKQAHDGVIIDIELDDFKGQQVTYEFRGVDLAKESKYKLTYSVNNQAVLENESESLTNFGFGELDRDERLAIERVLESGFDILSVIPLLENKYQAMLIEAELEEKNGIAFYEIKLASPESGVQKLLINVDNGEEIPTLKRHKK